MALKLILGSAALAVALIGCTTPGTPATGTGPAAGGASDGLCNAQGAQFTIGKAAGASVVESARQRSGSYMARVLRPNQAVTMDFNAQRLNLEVDAAGVIKAARCG
ncbi:I78 family peptidase inhibitor [Polaromonas sp. SM01]|uniref:I78 family peptidase inhibitor n=1 Tax=Polaromonas sp. SM01 TaxID=3085630 RepID=UPI002982B249|nr:I78 family peptidase inhibitor [Polaromonas sp. SM01]MDW5443189.1 I78 family peptidase inhibitor [Polaromonas sp. SM01]